MFIIKHSKVNETEIHDQVDGKILNLKNDDIEYFTVGFKACGKLVYGTV